MKDEKFSFKEFGKFILLVVGWIGSAICMFFYLLFMKIFSPETYKQYNENSN